MNKKLFLTSVLSIAILIAGASFASDESPDKVNQEPAVDRPLTKKNTTPAQRVEIIQIYKEQIKNLEKQINYIKIDRSLTNQQKVVKIKAIEEEIKTIRVRIKSLE